MGNFWRKLKTRWEVKNDFAAIMILVVFALTGSLSVKIISYIEKVIGITPDSSVWIKILSFIILVLPVYNLLLFIIGSLLGQHQFFKNFIIKFFQRLLFLKNK